MKTSKVCQEGRSGHDSCESESRLDLWVEAELSKEQSYLLVKHKPSSFSKGLGVLNVRNREPEGTPGRVSSREPFTLEK